MNKYLQEILNDKIDRFRFAFELTARRLYTNPETKKIYSPGEYGSYREKTCKEFIRSAIPFKLDIGDGFLINHSGGVSTQCDIVIYDRNNAPFIENDKNQRFFPVETVASIGEIKSNLSKSELKKALNKLARNKKLGSDISPHSVSPRKSLGLEEKSNPFREQVFSFLICHKFDFKIKSAEQIDKLYDPDIEPWQKHNMILSIYNGLFVYRDKGDGKILPYPFKIEKCIPIVMVPDANPNCDFNYFAHYMYMGTCTPTIYHTELRDYLDLEGGRIHG